MIIETIKRNHREISVVTSLDIAESFEKRHDNVLKDIRELKCSDEFRLLNFEEISYRDSYGKNQKAYYITRDGFTLLSMGYGGDKAMRFKEAYIRQFNNMERLLHEKYIEREKGTAVRNLLTDALKMSAGNGRNQDHSYSAYTNSIYKAVFGMNAKQLRDHYGIDKLDCLRDCFSSEELTAVQSMESLVNGLVACGWSYDAIRDFIERNNTKHIA